MAREGGVIHRAKNRGRRAGLDQNVRLAIPPDEPFSLVAIGLVILVAVIVITMAWRF